MEDFLKKLSKALNIKIVEVNGATVTIKALDDDAQHLLDINLKGKAERGQKVFNNTYKYIFTK